MMIDIASEVEQAEQRIRPYIRETPLDYSFPLSELTGCHVYLKLENLQYTGSFKLRGAMSKLLSVRPEERDRGIVAASSGNHGAAVAFGLRTLGGKGTIFVPEGTAPTKIELIRRYGAEIRVHTDAGRTESYARQYAAEHEMTYISPYNDAQVIAGQGTIAIELCRQLDHVDAVIVAVGGGGLIAGIAGYLKAVSPGVRAIGASPKNSPAMVESVQAGHIVDRTWQPTLSDGTAGSIEAGTITFDLCRTLVDDYILVSEDEIREGMRLFMENHHMLIEGAAAVAVASFLKAMDRFRGQNVVLVICGANISLETLRAIL